MPKANFLGTPYRFANYQFMIAPAYAGASQHFHNRYLIPHFFVSFSEKLIFVAALRTFLSTVENDGFYTLLPKRSTP
mgnify:CR=1 FL=1